MAIPPQFLKGKKRPNDDATEPKSQDNPVEDAQEGEGPKGKGKPTKSNKGNKHSNAKRAALLAQLRGGK